MIMLCRYQMVDGVIKGLVRKEHFGISSLNGLWHQQRVDRKGFVIMKELTERNVSCMHVVHVNENFSFRREFFFGMKLPILEEKLCMYVVCNACGNASR